MSKPNPKKGKSTNDEEEVPMEKKSRKDLKIPSNCEARIILFVITCLEWQAEYLSPAEFHQLDNPISLTRAVRAQCRDFGEKYKPSTKKKIYKDLLPKGPEPSPDDHQLAKTRYILGRILQQQLNDYEKAEQSLNDPKQLKERKEQIFKYPEDIPEIAALFDHLNGEQMPRKFRKILTKNPLGFENTKINDFNSFERLPSYRDVPLWGPKKKGHKRSSAEVERTVQLMENQRNKQRITKEALTKGLQIIKNSQTEPSTSKLAGLIDTLALGSLTNEENNVLIDLQSERDFLKNAESETHLTFEKIKKLLEEKNHIIIGINDKLRDNDTKLQEKKQTITELNAKLKDSPDISALNSQILQLQGKLQEKKQTITELNTKLECAQGKNVDYKQLKNESEDKDKKIAELEKELESVKQKLEGAQSMNTYQSKIGANATVSQVTKMQNLTKKQNLNIARPVKFKKIKKTTLADANANFEKRQYMVALQNFVLLKEKTSDKKKKEIIDLINKTANKILNSFTYNLDDMTKEEAEKVCLSFFGTNTHKNQAIERIIFPIKRYIDVEKPDWCDNIKIAINIHSAKLTAINKAKIIEKTVFEVD